MVTPQAVTAVSNAELLAARQWLSQTRSPSVGDEVIAELPPSAVYRALAQRYDGGWPQFQRDSNAPQRAPRGAAALGRTPLDRPTVAEEQRSR